MDIFVMVCLLKKCLVDKQKKFLPSREGFVSNIYIKGRIIYIYSKAYCSKHFNLTINWYFPYFVLFCILLWTHSISNGKALELTKEILSLNWLIKTAEMTAMRWCTVFNKSQQFLIEVRSMFFLKPVLKSWNLVIIVFSYVKWNVLSCLYQGKRKMKMFCQVSFCYIFLK